MAPHSPAQPRSSRHPRAVAPEPDAARADLVPRFEEQGYEPEQIAARRRWIEERRGVALAHVGACSIDGRSMRGNIENPIGAAQVPLGLAGPLLVNGDHARGVFYVPFATTEGALVRSYERGMTLLTRAGGAAARVTRDENRISPVFFLDDVGQAAGLCARLQELLPEIRAEAEATTRHGRLLRLEPRAVGREVMVHFCFSTGDAHGMNMIALAADRACRWIVAKGLARDYLLFSGMESEKHASGSLFAGGKGKTVVAGAHLPARLVRAYLNIAPRQLAHLWRTTLVGNVQAGVLGYNGHFANGLAALFIACGQDVANLANAAVGTTQLELTEGGDLYASVVLPALTVATVGGGTGVGTARECLELLGCAGAGGARKLAEIAAATLLAGELSLGAALAAGEFVGAHEEYGRNRPEAPP